VSWNLLKSVMLAADIPALSDGDLVSRYLDGGDEKAFEALMKRHGPMVWGVCRVFLHNDADVEDAFQATFIVLMRRANTISPRSKVGKWLYGVASNKAVRARDILAKRRAREVLVAQVPEKVGKEAPDPWADLKPLLDRELNAIPPKYKVPIDLFYLEGLTRKETAIRLGWPEGSVAWRISKGRKMLARRLTNRGITLSNEALVAHVASESVPIPLKYETFRIIRSIISVKTVKITENRAITALRMTMSPLLIKQQIGQLPISRSTPSSPPK
jgi:RNA polymerase sigma factor (sigma-70 family)